MKNIFKKVLATVLSATMIFSGMTVSANETPDATMTFTTKDKVVSVGDEVTYTIELNLKENSQMMSYQFQLVPPKGFVYKSDSINATRNGNPNVQTEFQKQTGFTLQDFDIDDMFGKSASFFSTFNGTYIVLHDITFTVTEDAVVGENVLGIENVIVGNSNSVGLSNKATADTVTVVDNIDTAEVLGIVTPEMEAEPVALKDITVPLNAKYDVTAIDWTPIVENNFLPSQEYKATVTLTADTYYQFTSSTNLPVMAGVSATNKVVGANGATLKFDLAFNKTESAIKDIEISGSSSALIPETGDTSYSYSSTVTDTENETIEVTPSWVATLSDGSALPSGISFDSNTATLKVSEGASPATVKIKATATKDGIVVTDTIDVTVANIEVDWSVLGVKNEITYGDTKVSAFENWSESAVATMNGNQLNGEFSIVNKDEVLSAGNREITVMFTVIGGDFAGATVSNTFNINVLQKNLRWTIGEAEDKVYDGTNTASVKTAPKLEGVINNDDVKISVGKINFNDKNVADGKQVTATEYSIIGEDIANYKLENEQPTFNNANITKAESIINNAQISSNDITYGEVFTVTADIGLNPVQNRNRTIDDTKTAVLKYGEIVLDTQTNVTENSTVSFEVDTKSQIIPSSAFDSTEKTFTIVWSGDENLNSSSATVKATLNKSQVTVTATASDKIYDANKNANNLMLTVNDNLAQDTVTATGTGTYSDKNVGENKTITVSNIVLAGEDAGYYKLAPTEVTSQADITAKEISWIEGAVENKVYDGTRASTITVEPKLDGVVLDDNINIVVGKAMFVDENVGENKTLIADSYNISGDDIGNYTLKTDQPTFSTANITVKAISWSINSTVDDKVYDGDKSATIAIQPDLTDVIQDDEIQINVGKVEFTSADVAENITVIASGYSITGADVANYSLPVNQPVFSPADITAKSLSESMINIDPSSYVFTGTDIIPTFNVDDIAGIDTNDYSVSYEDNINVGMAKIIINAKENGNYKDSASKEFEITKANISINDINTQIFNAEKTGLEIDIVGIPSNSGTVDIELGAVTGDDIINGIPTLNDRTIVFSSKLAQVGNTATIPVSIKMQNYNTVTIDANITVRDKMISNLTITGVPETVTYGDDDFTLSVQKDESSTGTYTWISGNEDVLSVEDGVVSINSVGTAVITVEYSSEQYAGSKQVSITVGKKTLSLENTMAVTKPYDGTKTAEINSGNLLGVEENDEVFVETVTGEYDNANAGQNKDVTVNGSFTLSGKDKDNYILTQPTNIKGTIEQAELIIESAIAEDKLRDGSTLTTATVVLAGMIGEEKLIDLTDYIVTADFDNADAGKDKEVTVVVNLKDTEKANNYKLTNNSIKTTADIIIPTHQVTVTNGTGGGIYEEDSKVFISADAPPTDMIFDKWVGDVEFEDETSENTSFTMPSGEVSVTATYKKDVELGDVDGNGSINNKDILRLFRYVSGDQIEVDISSADMDFDGVLTNLDVLILFKMVSQIF